MGSAKRFKQGFTIIELMVVVAVIAVLATIITRASLGAVRESRAKRAHVMRTAIANGIAVYHQQKSEWPGPLENCAANGENRELTGPQVDSVIQTVVEESEKANPMLDPSGLYIARRSIANNGSERFHGRGMDFGAARRQGVSLKEMAFGYQLYNGDFRRFKIFYDAYTDSVRVELQ